MASPTETMTAESAVRALRDIGAYEERLTHWGFPTLAGSQ
jgi:hypothetical protein